MINTLAGYVHAQLNAPHQKFEAIRDESGTLLGIAPVSKLRTAFYATPIGEAKSNRISMELSIALVELRNNGIRTEGEIGWNNLARERLSLPVSGQVGIAERALKIARVDLNQYTPEQMNRLRKIEQGMVYVDKGFHVAIPDDVENMSSASGASGLNAARLAGDISALWRMRGSREQRAEQFNTTRYQLDQDTWKITGVLPKLVAESKLNGTVAGEAKAGRADFLAAMTQINTGKFAPPVANGGAKESPIKEEWTFGVSGQKSASREAIFAPASTTVQEPGDGATKYDVEVAMQQVKHNDFLQRRNAVRERKESPPVAPKPQREASPKAEHELHYAEIGRAVNQAIRIPEAAQTSEVIYRTVDLNAVAPAVQEEPTAFVSRPVKNVVVAEGAEPPQTDEEIQMEGLRSRANFELNQAQRAAAEKTMSALINDGVSAKGKFTQGFINNPSRALVYHEAVQEAWVQIKHAELIYENPADRKKFVANLAIWQAQAIDIRRNNGLLDKLDPKSVPVRIYRKDLQDLSDSGLTRLKNLWDKSNAYAREYFTPNKFDSGGIVHTAAFREITIAAAAVEVAKEQFKPVDQYTSDLAKRAVYDLKNIKAPQRIDDAELHDLVAYYRANNPSSTL